MEVEFPFGTIHQLQISLRKGTNIPSYDPTDASLPGLPSVEDSIYRPDPPPPFLRCKNCKGRLLSGINSLFCVFCGKEQRIDAPPDPINFRSTTGYKWLLESLHLDGSVSSSFAVFFFWVGVVEEAVSICFRSNWDYTVVHR